jgi:hypothetical protein
VLTRILKTYDAPEIFMLAGATLWMCVSIAYVIGTL